MGRIAAVPRPALFDQALVDGLCAFNAGLPGGERIHLAGFDVNHWSTQLAAPDQDLAKFLAGGARGS